MVTENQKMKILGASMLLISLYLTHPLVLVFLSFLEDDGERLRSFAPLTFLSVILIYFSIKYIIGKPFNQNKILGRFLISIGVVYFICVSIIKFNYLEYLLSPVCFYLVLFGVGLNYFGKNNMIKK